MTARTLGVTDWTQTRTSSLLWYLTDHNLVYTALQGRTAQQTATQADRLSELSATDPELQTLSPELALLQLRAAPFINVLA